MIQRVREGEREGRVSHSNPLFRWIVHLIQLRFITFHLPHILSKPIYVYSIHGTIFLCSFRRERERETEWEWGRDATGEKTLIRLPPQTLAASLHLSLPSTSFYLPKMKLEQSNNEHNGKGSASLLRISISHISIIYSCEIGRVLNTLCIQSWSSSLLIQLNRQRERESEVWSGSWSIVCDGGGCLSHQTPLRQRQLWSFFLPSITQVLFPQLFLSEKSWLLLFAFLLILLSPSNTCSNSFKLLVINPLIAVWSTNKTSTTLFEVIIIGKTEESWRTSEGWSLNREVISPVMFCYHCPIGSTPLGTPHHHHSSPSSLSLYSASPCK